MAVETGEKESRTAAEVMDEVLLFSDGIDWIVAELDGCFEVTQRQDLRNVLLVILLRKEQDQGWHTGIGTNTRGRKHC